MEAVISDNVACVPGSHIDCAKISHTVYCISVLVNQIVRPTFGPQRGPRVIQQISVLHIEQRNQSQPAILLRII